MSTPFPPSPSVGEPIAYRPVSAFAVAGFSVAVLCALLVSLATVVALYQGMPFFYPLWLVLIPALGGFTLSLIARSRIRSSEGTQAGERLAAAGIWLSLLFGLGYAVYDTVTGFAVEQQANAFLAELGPDAGFLPHLAKASASKSELHAAFLLTVLPTSRTAGVRPEDEAAMLRVYDSKPDGSPGALSNFRKNTLVRILSTAPVGAVQYEPLGVQAWSYGERSYRVRRLYRISTPEVVFEVSLPAASSEGETAGEPRRWYIPIQTVGRPTDRQAKRTPFGEGIKVVRFNTATTLQQWANALNLGQRFNEFAQKDKTNWDTLPLKDKQGYVKARLQDLFASTEPRRLLSLSFAFEEESGYGDWKITEDKKVQIMHQIRLTLEARGSEPIYAVDGNVVVETTEPIDPAQLTTVQELPCTIHSFTITRAAPMLPKKEK
jgi:hypothetical protein